ncbi:MAG: ABC transporter substrate-binding protein [Thermosynechococcaceae cyanobacterium MS004]|nr:ABC transporter substrate-binding protein [Thermosynechococcaceae cyanobacterium MS004]
MQILFQTRFRFLSLVLLMLALAGCGQSQEPSSSALGGPKPAVADTTAAVKLKPASRVVALTSLSADILYRLDQTKLVAIPGSQLLSKNQDFAALPRVSEGRTPPNLEKIIALKPDLVVGAAGFHDPAIAKLKSLGIQTLLSEVDSWRSLIELTQTLADAVGADAAPLLAQYQGFLDKTSTSSDATSSGATLVLASRQPLMSPNAKSWAGDLLTQLNVKNVAIDLQGNSPMRGYITLSPEKILEANPDSVILVNTPQGDIEKIKSEPFWNQLKATQNQQVYTFDYYGLVNPGSIDAIEKATSQLKANLTQ